MYNLLRSLFPVFLLISVTVLTASILSSCNEDDLPDGSIFLKYDDEPVNAPLLPAGTFEAGARFPASSMGAYVGDNLNEIRYYLQAVPRTSEVRIYLGSNGNNPDSLIYTANVTTISEADSWNVHTLTTPITLEQQDLWIVLRFTLNTDARTLGCDPGPAVENGDWLFDSADQTWQKLSNRGPVDINWNIRGVVMQN